ncbi:hypothetical protein [Hymenobacter seoulensis]
MLRTSALLLLLLFCTAIGYSATLLTQPRSSAPSALLSALQPTKPAVHTAPTALLARSWSTIKTMFR